LNGVVVGFPGVPIQHVGAADREALLDIARSAIHAHLAGARPPRLDRVHFPPALWRPGATFVTLRRDGQLRGCIGSLEARRPLAVDVADNAVAAATRDPRFPPVEAEEEADLEVKISVLTPPEMLDVHSRGELASVVRPGVDGLLLEAGSHRGTFLPAVWEQLPAVDEFLDHLWVKAGLAPADWPSGLKVARYRSEEF
jgi:uncharacterized protein